MQEVGEEKEDPQMRRGEMLEKEGERRKRIGIHELEGEGRKGRRRDKGDG